MLSAFNTTQIFLNEFNSSKGETFKECYFCNKKFYGSEMTISCNYSKPEEESARFMLLLNKGNQINIKHVIPEKKEIPTDERSDEKTDDDEKKKEDGNKSLKLFCYIGIPIIVIAVVVIVVIIIIKRKKKKLSLDGSAKMLDSELIPKYD